MEHSKETTEDPFSAVQNGNLSLLKVSLLNGTNIQIQDKDGSTLLHHAAKFDQLTIVKYLIEKGIELTLSNNIGETVLHIAAWKNNLHIANVLFESVRHDEFRKFIDAKIISTGSSALHIAAKNGFYNMAMLLLSRGAAYNIKDKRAKKPIDVTEDRAISQLLKQLKINFEHAKNGQETLYEILEKCSIDEFAVYANARNNEALNVVQIAIVNCHVNLAALLQCSKVLLFRRHGYTPTFKTDYFDELLLLAESAAKNLQDENCPLNVALKQVRRFVSRFRSLDKRILDPNILGIQDMLRLLSCHRDAMSFAEHTKQTIQVHLRLFSASIYSIKLLESTRRKDWILAEKCMAGMAYVNISDEGGWTPMLHAVNAGNEKIIKMLIDHGARVNCWTKIGKNTSLHVAVNKARLDIVQLLLDKDNCREFVNAKTQAKGSTALHIAAKLGRLDIAMWLLKCRATYCLRNKNGEMPMDLFSDQSHRLLFKLIAELFSDVQNGEIKVVGKLEALSDDEFLAVVLCQDEDGRLLKDVALKHQCNEIADKITDRLKLILSGQGFKFNEE